MTLFVFSFIVTFMTGEAGVLRKIWYDRDASKDVLKLALPLMAAYLTQTGINLLDTVMVGFLPREYSIAGQAALGYSVILHWTIGGTVSAIAVGTQALAARRYGEGNLPESGKVCLNAVFLGLILSIIVTILAYIWAPQLFGLFSESKEVLRVGIPYLRMRFLGIPAMVMTLAYKAFFDGIGKTYYHLVAAIIMNVTNAFLNYILMFGAFGLPKLYVTGAGLGSAIASYIGLFIMIAWSLTPRYRKEFRIYRKDGLSWSINWSIIKLSVPSAVATLVVTTGFLLFFKIVGLLDVNAAGEGSTVLMQLREQYMYLLYDLPITKAAFKSILASQPPIYSAGTKVIVDIMSISFMSIMGIGVATATLVSQNLGKGRPDLAQKYAIEAVKIGITIGLMIGLPAVINPHWYLLLFTRDPEVIRVAAPALRFVGAFEWTTGIFLVLAQALFGAGNTKFVMVAEFIMHFTCLVPLAYLFGVVLNGGLIGVWSSIVAYSVLASIVMGVKFSTGSWKKIRI